MKKSLIYIIAALFLWSSCAFAIDKTTSKKKNPDKPDTTNQPVDPPANKTDSNATAQQNQNATNKDYNDFVDGNNNGVDDRMETGKNKPSSKDSSSNSK